MLCASIRINTVYIHAAMIAISYTRFLAVLNFNIRLLSFQTFNGPLNGAGMSFINIPLSSVCKLAKHVCKKLAYSKHLLSHISPYGDTIIMIVFYMSLTSSWSLFLKMWNFPILSMAVPPCNKLNAHRNLISLGNGCLV